ncbi:MAG: GIY-YIG nuclease family protein [Verrucomicrobiaceae bacterium]|nr:GIY-YIG nuclease family protein [Verrucomicrobiaceae bacterium]
MSEEITRAASPRQLKLFHLENPLTLRFGNDFFRSLPEGPGVYFFHGSDGRLLYIGQSSNLRARLGSYRHVGEDKHPRRTLRLVARIARIEWRECASAEAAIAEESRLLLEHRPPFNRAGVWKGDPWWLIVEVETGNLTLRLQHEARPGSLGPLVPAARHRLSTLIRALLRLANPGWHLSEFPHGLMASALPRECRLPVSSPSNFVEGLTVAVTGDLEALQAGLDALPPPVTVTEQAFWQEEQERLEKLKVVAPLRSRCLA